MAVAFEDQSLVATCHVPELNGPRPAGGERAAVGREGQTSGRLPEQREFADFFRGGDVPDAGGRIVVGGGRERAAAGSECEGGHRALVGLPDAHWFGPVPPPDMP